MYEAISAAGSAQEVAAFFHPDAEQIEFPSLMRPSGHRRPLSEMWTVISFKSLEISSWGRTIMEPLKRKQPRTVPNT